MNCKETHPNPSQGGEWLLTYLMEYKTASPDRYEMLKAFARENRRNTTLAEQVLWEHIRNKNLGVQFVRQHIIGDYIVDFVALDVGLVIEVDGGYHSERQQQENDEIREKELNRKGYHVIRFTNEEVEFDTDYVIKQIIKEIEC